MERAHGTDRESVGRNNNYSKRERERPRECESEERQSLHNRVAAPLRGGAVGEERPHADCQATIPGLTRVEEC